MDLRVFQWILKDASFIFADMFLLPPVPSIDATDREGDGHPPVSASDNNGEAPSIMIIEVAEDSATLEVLLRMYYPLPPLLTFADFDVAKPVLIASEKYQLKDVMPKIINAFLPHIRANPLRAYALAVRYNMHDLVRVAARAFLAAQDTAVYSEELEEISAGAYVRLMQYRTACQNAVDALFHVPWESETHNWCWHSCRNCVSHSCGVQRSKACRCGTAPWFTAYWNTARDLIKITPASEAIEDPNLIEMDELYECVTCRSLQSHKQRQQYTQLLVAEVERRIADVSQGPLRGWS